MNAIPEALRETPQWVGWKLRKAKDGVLKKVPTDRAGQAVDVKDRSKWSEYKAVQKFKRKGFVTTREDNFIGVDLDGCADPKTGKIAPWAREVIGHLGSYTEWSPSKTGIRIFGTAKRPWEDKHKVLVAGPQMVPDRNPGIEVYDHSRYFTVTGEPIGEKSELADITDKLDELSGMFGMVKFPYQLDDLELTEADEETIKRATAYLKKMDGGISGSNGHNATYRAAAAMVHGFCLPRDDAFYLLQEHHNPKCEPPWSDKELRHKVDTVNIKQTKPPHGYLLGKSKEKEDLPLPVFKLGDLIETRSDRGPEVIHGILREGEIMNVIGAPKEGKSWFLYNLLFSVAMGAPWLGRDVARKRVLLIDNELKPNELGFRLKRLGNALGVDFADLQDWVTVVPLRGRCCDINRIEKFLFDESQKLEFGLLLLDAFYRILPVGMSQNDNAQMTELYNRLDRIGERTNSAIVLNHHTSKGDQSGKRVTDIGAGAGAMTRATDTHLTLRPHQEEGHAVMDLKCRSNRGPGSETLKFKFPRWESAPLAAELRIPDSRKDQHQKSKDRETMAAVVDAVSEFASVSKIRRSTGFGPSRVHRGLRLLNEAGRLDVESAPNPRNKSEEIELYRVKEFDGTANGTPVPS